MVELPPDEVAWQVTRRDGRVYLISHVQRVGVLSFIAAIEWYWYAPGTSRNRLFDAYATQWSDVDWVIAAFPEGRFEAVRSLARKLGLRIADGVPTLVESRGGALCPTHFPGGLLPGGRDNHSMFTIENDGRNSPVYKSSMRDTAAMLQADQEINAIFNCGVRLTPQEIADYVYGPGFSAPAA